MQWKRCWTIFYLRPHVILCLSSLLSSGKSPGSISCSPCESHSMSLVVTTANLRTFAFQQDSAHWVWLNLLHCRRNCMLCQVLSSFSANSWDTGSLFWPLRVALMFASNCPHSWPSRPFVIRWSQVLFCFVLTTLTPMLGFICCFIGQWSDFSNSS